MEKMWHKAAFGHKENKSLSSEKTMELQIIKLKEMIEIQKSRNHVFSDIRNPESSNRWGGGEGGVMGQKTV